MNVSGISEIDKDHLSNYLEKLDSCIKNTIIHIEKTSYAFDNLVDMTFSYSQFNQSLKVLLDGFNKIYFEDRNLGISELDPDLFQELDLSFSYFISSCHSVFSYLYNSDEANLRNYWYINSIFKDCKIKYEDILKYRRNPEVETIAICKLPRAIILGVYSRNLSAMNQKLKRSKIEVTKLELSGNSDSPQLEIELSALDNKKESLYSLALECLQLIKDELSIMNNINNILIAFQIEERPRNTWLRVSKSSVLNLLSKKTTVDEFMKSIPEFYYVDDFIKSSMIIKDLADNSSQLNKDYEIIEVLKEAFDQLEVIKNKAKECDSNDLVALMLEYYFPAALLDIIRIMLNVILITNDHNAKQKIVKLLKMFHLPNQVKIKKDYLSIYLEMKELMKALEFRYVVIKNVKPVNIGSKILDSPRVAIVQPRISIYDDYRDYQLTSDGRDRHLKAFNKYFDEAVKKQANIIIFPEMFFPISDIEHLAELSVKSGIIIITGLDYELSTQEGLVNSCAIALPDGRLIRHKKLYRSKYDHPKMSEGNTILVFNDSAIGNFSVFICVDYLNPEDLITLRGVVDALFVIALNPDHNTYAISALKDSYSTIYGFVCIVNAFDPEFKPPIWGRSGIYGPLHNDNKVMAQFKNADSGILVKDLPLVELRKVKSGNKSKHLKSLPPAFKSKSLARDYPEEEIENMREQVNNSINKLKHKNLTNSKKDYEAIRKSNISENWEYDLKRQKYAIMDISESHHGAKARLRACILIEKGLTKENIKQIIKIANEDIKRRKIFSNERQEAHYKDKIADVVWIDFFNERRHRRYLTSSDYVAYFVCRTQWVRPGLDPRLAQSPLRGDEIVDDIEIKWNSNYISGGIMS